MKFLDITLFQTKSTILLKTDTLNFTHQVSLLILTLFTFLSDAVYFRAMVLVLSSSTSALVHLSNKLRHQSIVNLGFLLIAVKVLIQFTGVNLQTMQLLLSGQESENQHLLNRFTIWCKWAQIFPSMARSSHIRYIKQRSSVQSNLPTNIFYFSVKYINNTLQTQTNRFEDGAYHPHLTVLSALHKKKLFSMLFVIAKFIFNRVTVLGDTIPSSFFIAKTFQSLQHANIYDDARGSISFSIVTGDDLPPDLLPSISVEWLALHFRADCGF